VTISANADATTGSSCDLKAGEQVSVGELLYGLLLPSGNDASVALAEHFGGRMVGGNPIGNAPSSDAAASLNSASFPNASENFQKFVQAMNGKAKQIGLNETTFTNTHGLTEEGHLTSARDLLRLSSLAMQQEAFRSRASTLRRGCRVTSTSGYQRNVLWENTNRLLTTEGFSGIKTGTTNAAGCCLVACEQRDDREMIVVILGSTSTESRYADAQNLLGWAWRQSKASGQ